MSHWFEKSAESLIQNIRTTLGDESSEEDDADDNLYSETQEQMLAYEQEGSLPHYTKSADVSDIENNILYDESRDNHEIPEQPGISHMKNRFNMPKFLSDSDYEREVETTPLNDILDENDPEDNGSEQGLNFLGEENFFSFLYNRNTDGYDPDEEYSKNESVLTKDLMEEIGIENGNIQIENIFFAFLTLNPADSSNQSPEDSIWRWINQFVTGFTKYIHCEIIFMIKNTKNGKRYRLISSIHRSHELRLTTKEYKKKRLKFLKFYHYDCDNQTKKKLFEFEKDNNYTPFNNIGFMWNFVMPLDLLRVDCKGEKVFCSEEICRNLKNADPEKHKGLVPYSAHPHALLIYLQNRGSYSGEMLRECKEPTVDNPSPVYV